MYHLESENEGMGKENIKKKKKDVRPQQAGPRYENEFRGKNNLYGVNRKTMTISNAHYMFIFFPQTAISF